MSGSAPLHKLPAAGGKDCTEAAAALLRSHREQADHVLRDQLREEIARGLEILSAEYGARADDCERRRRGEDDPAPDDLYDAYMNKGAALSEAARRVRTGELEHRGSAALAALLREKGAAKP